MKYRHCSFRDVRRHAPRIFYADPSIEDHENKGLSQCHHATVDTHASDRIERQYS